MRMGRFKSTNPAFKSIKDQNYEGEVVTVGGVVNKTLILLLIAMISGVITAYGAILNVDQTSIFTKMSSVLLGTSLIFFIIGFIGSMFSLSKIFPILYAIGQGSVLGVVSILFEQKTSGIIGITVIATLTIFFTMLFLYKTGIIKVTQKFRAMVIGALTAYFIFIIFNLGMSFFGAQNTVFTDSGGLSIGISCFAVLLGSLVLVLDFDRIDQFVKNNADDKYEWKLAFGLVLTILWLYIEIMKLVAKVLDN